MPDFKYKSGEIVLVRSDAVAYVLSLENHGEYDSEAIYHSLEPIQGMRMQVKEQIDYEDENLYLLYGVEIGMSEYLLLPDLPPDPHSVEIE